MNPTRLLILFIISTFNSWINSTNTLTFAFVHETTRTRIISTARGRLQYPFSESSSSTVILNARKNNNKASSHHKKKNKRQTQVAIKSPPPEDANDLFQKQQRTAGEQGDYDFTKRLGTYPALVLNADYRPISHMPLSIFNWKEAMKAIFGGKVIVLDTYPDMFIRSVNNVIPLPSVLVMKDYIPKSKKVPPFTRRNLFLRDEFQCQYCQNRFHENVLTMDHVVPRCMGGRLCWDNVVTCCNSCNRQKGSLSLNQIKNMGMHLHKSPTVPTQFELHKKAQQQLPHKMHPAWDPYLH